MYEQLARMEDVQAGAVDAEGDLLPGERLAEPDLAPGGEHVTAGRDDSYLLIPVLPNKA